MRSGIADALFLPRHDLDLEFYEPTRAAAYAEYQKKGSTPKVPAESNNDKTVILLLHLLQRLSLEANLISVDFTGKVTRLSCDESAISH